MSEWDRDVVIIGAGMGGICMAIQLQEQLGCTNVAVFEKGPDMGGSWLHAKYPGVGCDVPMIAYGFSFSQKYWAKQWAPGADILAYFQGVAQDYGVDQRMTFNTEFLGGQWNDTTNRWDYSAKNLLDGSVITGSCKIIVSAIGGLSIPNEVTLEGKDQFQGTIIHTGAYVDTDLEGKDVVVLGNGCSGTQVVPPVAAVAKSVTQFGRSKHWYLPRKDAKALTEPWLMRNSALARDFMRRILLLAMDYDFKGFHMVKGQAHRANLEKISRSYIKRKAPEQYWDDLIPNFPIGTKRRVFNSGYLEALNLPHVKFYFENPVALTENGIQRANGEVVHADVVIAATGYQTQETLSSLNVKGYTETLREHMGNTAPSYLGTFFAGFPNFGMIMGPNVASGHTSVTFHTECQVNMLIKVFRDVLQGQADAVEVKPQAEKDYSSWIRRKMKELVFEGSWESNPESRAWYTTDQGICTATFPAYQTQYWWMTYWVRWRDFRVKNQRRSWLRAFLSSKLAMLSTATLAAAFIYGGWGKEGLAKLKVF